MYIVALITLVSILGFVVLPNVIRDFATNSLFGEYIVTTLSENRTEWGIVAALLAILMLVLFMDSRDRLTESSRPPPTQSVLNSSPLTHHIAEGAICSRTI